jgi:uncharacterized damage-inducible protein DinB
MSEDLRYPVGKFEAPASYDDTLRAGFLKQIEEAPARMREAVAGLSEAQLETPYRPGGWTVRQVVHHVPDSHLNAYTRFRLALTEDEPTIRPYMEDRWAELPDSKGAPVEISLALLERLHERWMLTLRALSPEQLQRTFRHPDLGLMTLDRTLAMYAWHGRHHVGHITQLRQRSGW